MELPSHSLGFRLLSGAAPPPKHRPETPPLPAGRDGAGTHPETASVLGKSLMGGGQGGRSEHRRTRVRACAYEVGWGVRACAHVPASISLLSSCTITWGPFGKAQSEDRPQESSSGVRPGLEEGARSGLPARPPWDPWHSWALGGGKGCAFFSNLLGPRPAPLLTQAFPPGTAELRFLASLAIRMAMSEPRPSCSPHSGALHGRVGSHPSHKRPSQEQEISSIAFSSEISGMPFPAVS